jgi:hypothetical protein
MDVRVEDDADLLLQIGKDMPFMEIVRRLLHQREAVSRRLSEQESSLGPLQMLSLTNP